MAHPWPLDTLLSQLWHTPGPLVHHYLNYGTLLAPGSILNSTMEYSWHLGTPLALLWHTHGPVNTLCSTMSSYWPLGTPLA